MLKQYTQEVEMQKNEILTIRTNSNVKKMVEEAKLSSGQTGSEWLEQAVLAWCEKHDNLPETIQADSVHILAGRKALSEVSKILEALELAGKQTLEACKQDNLTWQQKYNQLEEVLVEKEKFISEQKKAYTQKETDLKQQLNKQEEMLNKLNQEIKNFQAHKNAIQEVTQCLEQERSISLRLHNSKEVLEKAFQELEQKHNKLSLDLDNKTRKLESLQEQLAKNEQVLKTLQVDLADKERENIKLNLNSKYLENTLAQLQASIDTQNLQIKDLQLDNLNLLTQKSELAGEINSLKKQYQKKS